MDKRKLEAVEKLWGSIVEASKYTPVAMMMVGMNIEAVFADVRKGGAAAANIAKLGDMLATMGGMENYKADTTAAKERLSVRFTSRIPIAASAVAVAKWALACRQGGPGHLRMI